MLIVRIMGGLGNQLFQYCFALLLQESGKEVVLEKTHFKKDSYKREYLLDLLPNRLQLLEDSAAKMQFGRSGLNRLKRRLSKTPEIITIKEDSAETWQQILSTKQGKKSVRISGYWQVAEMVEQEKILRQDLRQLRDTVAVPNELQSTTVAVHVRQLWTYAADGKKLKEESKDSDAIYLTVDYYRQAIERVQQDIPNAVFAIFGDDEQWCREHLLPLTTPDSVVMAAGQRPDWQDMLLMSRHQAVICANSSFSWWSGTLCDGMVIAPATWSHNTALHSNIHMSHWVKI